MVSSSQSSLLESSGMKISDSSLFIILLILVSVFVQIHAETATCTFHKSPCFLKYITCPPECPSRSPKDPKAKACFINSYSPVCKAECKNCRPNCHGPGAACLDPRFIGGDGIVFYFHGKSNEHYSLVSDLNLQINSLFIGHRPAGTTRDYTWIQALGFLFDSQTFSLEATKAATWDDEIDHLKLTTEKNLPYLKIPSDDCFAHPEVQFRFCGLSSKVEGVLGRTYQPDFKNPAKPGVAMPVVGGEDKYRTRSLLSAECNSCIFSPAGVFNQKHALLMEYGTLDCSGSGTSGNGILCRK
ncbi:Root cap/late embryogenesis-like protein [Melia azedarach]|uniref:Root cap/late embryogenesis-like protein n=1 Tax=Melia azedarach TaxID=155640 RepID=A0ACC1YSC1_MELAZ|nr:Root cap/late embryogenesis-like protein [Melia azedarach]